MRTFKPRRILVPTDFSATADHAFGAAEQIANRFGAELIVVHTDLPIPIEFGYPNAAYVSALGSSETDLEERLQVYADERLADGIVPYRTQIIHEGPIVGIAKAAEELDADLIVMATHGRTGWRRAVLGSVTEGVMRMTKKPVLTVRDEIEMPFTRILCPVNFTPASRNALEYASSLSVALNAELLVVHVLELGNHLMLDERPPLREWVPAEVRNRSSYVEFVERGDPAEEIVGFADRFDASLIVLGAQHDRLRDHSVLGTTSERVVRYANRPVLTVVSPMVEKDVEVMEEALVTA